MTDTYNLPNINNNSLSNSLPNINNSLFDNLPKSLKYLDIEYFSAKALVSSGVRVGSHSPADQESPVTIILDIYIHAAT